MYCGNDPVNLVDPDGCEVEVTENYIEDVASDLNEELPYEVGFEGNMLTAEDDVNVEELTDHEANLYNAIKSKNIRVKLKCVEYDQYNGEAIFIGAFLGSKYTFENNKILRVANQLLNPSQIKHVVSANRKNGVNAGHYIWNEIEEAYIGARYYCGTGIDNYIHAHNSAYPLQLEWRWMEGKIGIEYKTKGSDFFMQLPLTKKLIKSE